MSKGRMISSEIWEDDYFIELSLLERMIWIGLLTCSADDQGRMQDNARLIHSQLFPVDDLDDSLIEKALEKFASAGKIVRYKSEGKKLIQITNWWRYQSPRWCGKSKYSPPEGWIDRERYHAVGGKIVEKNWRLPGGFSKDSIADSIGETTTLDVNDDVDVEVDDDGDVDAEIAPSGDCGDLITEFVQITGIEYPQGRKAETDWDYPLSELKTRGLTISDMRTAIKELDDKKYAIVSPKSIFTACDMVLKRRKRKGDGGYIPASASTFSDAVIR